jgi:hypothetical protein
LQRSDILSELQFPIVAPSRARQFGPNGNVAIIYIERGADFIFFSVFDADFTGIFASLWDFMRRVPMTVANVK